MCAGLGFALLGCDRDGVDSESANADLEGASTPTGDERRAFGFTPRGKRSEDVLRAAYGR